MDERQIAQIANDVVDDLLIGRDQWLVTYNRNIDVDWSVMTSIVRDTLIDCLGDIECSG